MGSDGSAHCCAKGTSGWITGVFRKVEAVPDLRPVGPKPLIDVLTAPQVEQVLQLAHPDDVLFGDAHWKLKRRAGRPVSEVALAPRTLAWTVAALRSAAVVALILDRIILDRIIFTQGRWSEPVSFE